MKRTLIALALIFVPSLALAKPQVKAWEVKRAVAQKLRAMTGQPFQSRWVKVEQKLVDGKLVLRGAAYLAGTTHVPVGGWGEGWEKRTLLLGGRFWTATLTPTATGSPRLRDFNADLYIRGGHIVPRAPR